MLGAIYLHDWKTTKQEGVKNDFQITDADLEGVTILFATYGEHSGYDGEAFVLFRKDGALYEINGSHCSCHGLEEQWKPELASVAELRNRLAVGHFGSSGASPFVEELAALLVTLEG